MTVPGEAPRSRRSLWIALAVLGAGVVTAVAGFVGVLAGVIPGVLGGDAFPAPGSADRHLASGTHELLERISTTGDEFPNQLSTSFLTPSDVTVHAPDGSTVPVAGPGGGHMTVRRGSNVYEEFAQFDAPVDGTYAITIDGDSDGGASTVLITRPFGEALHDALGWVLVLAAGVGLGFVGVVLLIVRTVRTRPRPAAAGWGAPPPPGWYPDQSGAAQWRWWDGSRWTEHTG